MKTKEKAFGVGSMIGIVAFKNAYDAWATRVLADYFENVEVKRGQRAQIKVVKEMPTREEYFKLKSAKYTTTVADLVADAGSEIECLRDELQSWFDNLPESFQQGSKGSELEEAISELEIDMPDIPESCNSLETVYAPPLDSSSRADRASDCAAMLREAGEAVQEKINDASEEAEKNGGTFAASELEDFIGELESAADSIEQVCFPGMY